MILVGVLDVAVLQCTQLAAFRLMRFAVCAARVVQHFVHICGTEIGTGAELFSGKLIADFVSWMTRCAG